MVRPTLGKLPHGPPVILLGAGLQILRRQPPGLRRCRTDVFTTLLLIDTGLDRVGR